MAPIDLSSELPSPRDDEPSSLRQDIFDELADHLECSLHRERVKTGDDELARRNVIHRFGNPTAIARKLWWDAMWEKIMLQRISTILSSVTAIAALAVCVMLWRSLEASRDVQAQQLAKFEASLTALVDELRKKPEAKPESNWADVTVKLVREDGTPAQGKVYLIGIDTEFSINNLLSSATRVASLSSSAGADGIARVTGVPYDKYKLIASMENPDAYATQQVFVSPGNVTFEFTCPNTVPEINVRVEMQPPEDLKGLPFRYVLGINADSAANAGATIWTMNNIRGGQFVFGSDGQYLGQNDNDSSQYYAPSGASFWTWQNLAPSPMARMSHNTARFQSSLQVYSQMPPAAVATLGSGEAIPADAYFEVKGLLNSRQMNSVSFRKLTPGENVIRINDRDSFWDMVRALRQTPLVEIGNVTFQLQQDGTYQLRGPGGRGSRRGGGSAGFGGGGFATDPLTGQPGARAGGGGRGGSARGGRGSSLINELRRPSASAYIQLTAEQLTQLDALRSKTASDPLLQGERLARLQNAVDDGERANLLNEFNQSQAEARDEIDAEARSLLTPEQRTKLDSFRLQRIGPQLLLSDAALSNELGMTAEQLQAIQAISQEFQQGTSNTNSGEVRQKAMDDYQSRVLEVLTPQQRAAWDAKVGPPIDFSALQPANPPTDNGGNQPAEGGGAAGGGRRSGGRAEGPARNESASGIGARGGFQSRPRIGNLLSEAHRSNTQALLALSTTQRERLEAVYELLTKPVFENPEYTTLTERVQAASTEQERAAATRERLRWHSQWEQEQSDKADAEVRSLLTPEQRTKLDGIRLQRSGPSLLISDEVLRTHLGITPEQLQAMRFLISELATPIQGIEARETYQNQLNQKLLAILTLEQRAAWDTKVGPPIPLEVMEPSLHESMTGRGITPSALRHQGAMAFMQLTEDQRQQLNAIWEKPGFKVPPELSARQQSAGTEEERSAIFQEIRNQQAAHEAAVNAEARQILTPEQRAKLDSIRIQRSGPQILPNDETLRAELGITADQLQTLQNLIRERNALMQGEAVERREAIQTEYNPRLLEVLTPMQRAAWNVKVGPPIQLDFMPPPPIALEIGRGGGGGGFGGRGNVAPGQPAGARAGSGRSGRGGSLLNELRRDDTMAFVELTENQRQQLNAIREKSTGFAVPQELLARLEVAGTEVERNAVIEEIRQLQASI